MSPFRTQRELIDGFRSGTREALEAVYWSHVDRVERIVCFGFQQRESGRLPGVPAAEVPDLVQEVFARLFRESTRQAFDPSHELAPYLAAIARNVVIDWARKHRHEIVETAGDVDDVAAAADVPEANDDELIRETERYLATLPSDLAALHEQRYVLGRSQEEAARALGLTRQNVRTLETKLRRGLEQALRRARLSVER
ncbi:MAG TPA: sigma-70 family RNA polymerase sigma factor [Polyangia bacterium]|nr:sigma-70 family RNA polymerase sigma factor [Polyangia bacterium]